MTKQTETAFQKACRELDESRRAENLRRYGNADITPVEIRAHNERQVQEEMSRWHKETGITGGFTTGGSEHSTYWGKL